MQVVDQELHYPVRHEYQPREELPGFVDLGRVHVNASMTTPGWLILAGVDEKWNHVTVTDTEYRDGCYRPLLDGGVRLVVTCAVPGHAEHGERHPEWDDKRFGSWLEAWRFAYDQGLIRVNVYPPLGQDKRR
jgi:hypothetical protein